MLNRTIRKITLKNVGPFKEVQTIEFAPFTLIFGKNSAGKSYLLNVIKQLANPFRSAEEFAEANIKGFDRHFSKDNPINIKWEIPVNDGKDRQIYFELNLGKQAESGVVTKKVKKDDDSIEIIQKFSDEKDQQFIEMSFSDYKIDNRLIFRIFLSNQQRTIDVVARKIINSDKNEIDFIDNEIIMDFDIVIQSNQMQYDKSKLQSKRNDINIKNLKTSDVDIIGKITDRKFLKYFDESIRVFNNSLSMISEQFDYIPAHRLTPSKQNTKKEFLKIYNRLWGEIQTGEENYNISDSIVGIEQHYSLKEDITENLAPKKEETSKGILDSSQNTHYWSADDILKWEGNFNTDWKAVFLFLLDRLGYGNYDFLVDYLKIEGMDELFKISIKKDGQGTKQTLDEIGYGISQIFPVITAIALSKDRLIVEEPEIHLHPSAQLNFIRALVELDKEKIRPFHYVFETHSEVMIRGLQREIAKSNESNYNQKFSIIYLKQDENGASELKQIRVKSDGFLEDKWPEDYFNINHDLASDLWYPEKN